MAKWWPFLRDRRPLQIVCGSTHTRFSGPVNHAAYAQRHHLPYRFDTTPFPGLPHFFFQKEAAILAALDDAEWTFWLDDDAYFTQMDRHLGNLLALPEIVKETQLVFCRSPVNNGVFTYISAGNLFARSTALIRDALREAMFVDLKVVHKWWDAEKYGGFYWGDQEALVYLIETNADLRRATTIVDYRHFNCRPFHYAAATDHFLVHFAGGGEKQPQIAAFANRHGLDQFLLPAEMSADLAVYRFFYPDTAQTRASLT